MSILTKLVTLSLAASAAAIPLPWKTKVVEPPAVKGIMDINNAPNMGMILDNGNRLVMKVDCPNCDLVGAREGETASLIYDVTVNPEKGNTLDWTGKIRGLAWNQTLPFYPPSVDAAVVPYTYASTLTVSSHLQIPDYVAHNDSYTGFKAVVGLIESSAVRNNQGWKLTRVTFINDVEVYNVSIAAVYFQQVEDRVRLVWWEQVPIEEAYSKENSFMWNMNIPDGLRYKLISELGGPSRSTKFSWLGLGFVAALSLAAIAACVAFERNRRRQESRKDLRPLHQGILNGSSDTLGQPLMTETSEHYTDNFVNTRPRTMSQVIFSRDSLETPVVPRQGDSMEVYQDYR